MAQARDLMTRVLQEISRRFPQVEERKLPDDSVIFELKQKTEPFLTEEDDSELKGLITYPFGQLTYGFFDNKLRLNKTSKDYIEVVENSCSIPEYLALGFVKAEDEEDALWKNLNFGYKEGYLVFCLQ